MHDIALPTPTPTLEVQQFAGLKPLDFVYAGFLAAYSGCTFTAYKSDLDHYLAWCRDYGLPPLQALRAHLELYLRHLQNDGYWTRGGKNNPPEQRAYSSATVNRRFTTVGLFYRYAYEEEVIERDPGRKIKRPKIDKDAQRRTFLTALEHGLFTAAAKKMGPTEHCLAVLLAGIALRISEATQLDVTDVVQVDGYDHVRFVGKGGKAVTLPLPIPAMRAVRACIGDRTDGPLLLNSRGRRLDRAAATRMVRKIATAAEVNSDISPHSLRRAFCTTGLDMGIPLRDMQRAMRHRSPDTTIIYDRGGNNPDSNASHRIAGQLARLVG